MDRLETPARIEPCGLEEQIPESLVGLALDLQAAAHGLGSELDPDSAAEIRRMVRIMNAYYSNLIEGHATKPTDIEAALGGNIEKAGSRPLAEEAMAHVRVQEWIDDAAQSGTLPDPVSVDFIRELHRRFYAGMPRELRFAESQGKRGEIIPGLFRQPGEEVVVGRHHPPSAHRLGDFMAYFERRYRGLMRSASGRILAIPAAHHRLNYIHPFLDGNGRVSRLMSHAMAHAAGIGGHGLWSISRGLARGLQDRSEYMAQMDSADQPRRGDLDGRGNLSRAALESFTAWFLTVALDQVRFMSAMLDLQGLRRRCTALVRDLHPGDGRLPALMDHVLRRGRLSRGDVRWLLGVSERTARNDVATLLREGLLKSDSHRDPLRPGFPLAYRERLFPNLFTDGEPAAPASPGIPSP